jgi:alpha 1,2-mannosyltransferase
MPALLAGAGIRRYHGGVRLFGLILTFSVVIIVLRLGHQDVGPQSIAIPLIKAADHADEWRQSFGSVNARDKLWRTLQEWFEDCRPSLTNVTSAPFTIEDKEVWPTAKYKVLLNETDLLHMQYAHQTFLSKIEKHAADNVYKLGSVGIVTTSTRLLLPAFLVSLRILRRTGCTLPVEYFLSRGQDYDVDFCENILPSMNARCRFFVDGEEMSSAELIRFQYKIFAILFSSFEDVIFLDGDNLALQDPSSLLTSEPFLSTGLILWPDFWPSTISPHLATIVNKSIKASSHRTCETGQLVISKSKHWKTLLLTAYYNYHGPHLYYSLASQGGHGEGDKELYRISAEVLGMPYYLVKKKVEALGFVKPIGTGTFRGVSMVQFDAAADAKGFWTIYRTPALFIHA